MPSLTTVQRGPGLDRSPTLLVTRDDVLARRLQGSLARAGHDVRRASDPTNASMLLLGGVWDLVVLDVALPTDERTTVLQRLMASEHTRRLPVILAGKEPELAPMLWACRGRTASNRRALRAVEAVCAACIV